MGKGTKIKHSINSSIANEALLMQSIPLVMYTGYGPTEKS